MDEYPSQMSHPLTLYKTSLPATTNWPGPYYFNVSFTAQENNVKHLNWIYSEKNKRLYVKKDVPCPISFSTNLTLENAFVRAMAVFTSPESASDVVTRCINHSMTELQQGVWEAEHIVRCESTLASYQVNPESKRHSVVVPFENPPVGQDFSTYIYKFLCFTSCAGGPNRRPLTLIFTLENEEAVLGRHAIQLKVCASPQRDVREAEKAVTPSNNCLKQQFNLPEMCDTSFLPTPKLRKPKSDDKQEYVIKVKDFECYTFLKQMQKAFEMNEAVASIPTHFKTFFPVSKVRSSDEEEKQ